MTATDWVFVAGVCIIVGVLLRTFVRRRSRNEWLFMMRKTMRLPNMKDCNDGWVECTCTNCYHRFLWWREDACVCTKCGLDFHHTRESEDWQPMG